MYNPELTRIDRQIEDLQRMKTAYQNMNPAPINNIINTQQNQSVFEAKFTTADPADIFVERKTAFINLKDGRLTIKDGDGDMKDYPIILPKDEKDVQIEQQNVQIAELQNQINELKGMVMNRESTKSTKSIEYEQKSDEYGNADVTKSKLKNDVFKARK